MILVITACALLLAACPGADPARPSSPASVSPAVPTLSLPCDVQSVVTRRCQGCHGEEQRFGAPMPLTTLSNISTFKSKISARTHDAAKPMPPPPNALTSADLGVLDAWLAGGAQPAEGVSCPVERPEPLLPPQPTGCTPDVHIAPTSPFAIPAADGDVYVCYGFDVHASEKRHITGLFPRIDNVELIHHIDLFKNNAAPLSGVPRRGSCGGQLLYVWVPGGNGLEMPPLAGFPLEEGDHLVLEIHYKNPRALAGKLDASGYDLCTTSQLRPYDADVIAFGAGGLDIPARSRYALDCAYTVTSALEGATVSDMLLHMHLLGTSIGVTLKRGDTDAIVLGTQDPFPEENQAWFGVRRTLRANDVVTVSGVYENTLDHVVHWGLSIHDEMFYAYALMYPRVTQPPWEWDSPVIGAKCSGRVLP